MAAFDLNISVLCNGDVVVKNHMVDVSIGRSGKPSRSAIANRVRRISDLYGYDVVDLSFEPVEGAFVIFPYYDPVVDMWVFDDALHGLFGEPLVEGIDDMLDLIVDQFGYKKRRAAIAFSNSELKNPFAKLSLVGPCGKDGRVSGNDYIWEERDMKGWLCPALYNYYGEAPKDIFIKVVEGSPASCWRTDFYASPDDFLKQSPWIV